VSYHPFVKTKHPVMDVVIVRENEEDLYAGIEYQQSDQRHAVPEADLAARLREDRALRVRIRRATTARR
jgi:isocitrate/isopropylmalate dehydrogenase